MRLLTRFLSGRVYKNKNVGYHQATTKEGGNRTKYSMAMDSKTPLKTNLSFDLL